VFETRYLLPLGLTCTQCILQWRYIAGNNWGICENGTGAVGCGPQEEFRACADVEIVDSHGTADETPFYNEIPTHEENKTKEETSAPTEKTHETVTPHSVWMVAMFAGFMFISTAIALILALCVIYYKDPDRVKRWIRSERFLRQTQKTQQPIPPPRVKKQKSGNTSPDV